MKIAPELMEFEWDGGNAEKSLNKHGIGREEAESVFVDSKGLVMPDEKLSDVEKRFLLVGKSNKGRFLLVSFIFRRNKVRIISVRRMHQEEVEKYEKIKNNS